MIKIRIRNADHEIDILFPTEQRTNTEKLF